MSGRLWLEVVKGLQVSGGELKGEIRDDGGREVIQMLVVSKMIGNMTEKLSNLLKAY